MVRRWDRWATARRARDQVAEMRIRSWDPEQRARIRAMLLAELDASDPDVLQQPAMQLIAMIDRVTGTEGNDV